MYSRLIPALKDQGYRTLIAVIAVPNQPSVRLHKAFGFTLVGTLARVGWKFDKWHDVEYWQLALCDDENAPSAIEDVKNICGESACAE